MQSIVSFHKTQQIFHSIILFTDEYYQIMWVLVFTTIAEQRRLSWIMLGKDNISVWLTRHFKFLLLRTREGYMPTITKSRLITDGTITLKHAWARLPSRGIERDSAIIDLAYLFAGLVTITQFRLVHCILQGVEHTDPTEWSNSQCSIGDEFVMAVRRTASLSLPRAVHYFLFNNKLVIHMVTAPQHSYNLKALNLSRNGSQLHILITCCFANSSSIYQLYFNIINTTQ